MPTDFKDGPRIKDPELMRAVIEVLDRPLRNRKASLRIDANAGWSLEQATAQLAQWHDLPIAAVEQPLPKDADHELPGLKEAVSLPFMLAMQVRLVMQLNLKVRSSGGSRSSE